MPEMIGVSVTVVDVISDIRLVTRYGQRLPVLASAGEELDAPLTPERVRAFLEGLPSG